MKLGVDGSGSEEEDAAVAALVMLHRRRQKKVPRGAPGSEYQRVVAHFERRGERLRGERLATEELVERLLGANGRLAPAPVQRELEIHGPARKTAAGRVRVRNSSPVRRAFELTVVGLAPDMPPPAVHLDPRQGVLSGAESCWVRIVARLDDLAPGDCAALSLECRWETGIDRIWLTIRADPSDGGRP